ncbi:anti-sigma factor domain-containing protein [Pedobacter sp. L105]|uniref:anti-sigma factor n=1 Tax=Pedobacter sp. L105 TaxID=1641871 RepID=UPI00131E43D4|nr:anti-sigma factor [Pedobacter sp. L105]
MEEAKAYIETGILELYVLGQLNALEQLEVEEMAAKYPEIKEEITAIEIAMEHYALSHAIQPTSGLEKQIFERITPATTNTTAKEKPEAKIVPLYNDNSASTIRSLRFALVACIALLVISTGALYSAHSSLTLANQQIASLSLDKQKFASTVSYITDENKDLQKIAAISSDPTWTPVKLSGTKISPKANLVVYWHKAGHHVVLDNTKMALPENDADHQYQLWAMVNGKPVDLGVFDAQSQPKKLLVTMKEIGNAQAFAVTLEKRGGSVNPTMEKMVVLGGVTI